MESPVTASGAGVPARDFSWRAFAAILLAALAAGCGVASAPIKNPPQVVATPRSGEVAISAQSGQPVGNVLPVFVSVANGTDTPRSIVPSQIFALNENGDRVAPLPPGEAARDAGGAGVLKAVLTSAAASGLGFGAVGAGIGAAAGAAFGSPGTGAALGSAIGGGEGVLMGAPAGAAEARSQASQQIGALALQGGQVRKDFTTSGYVFFPKGSYKEIEILLVNGENGNTETIKQPWH